MASDAIFVTVTDFTTIGDPTGFTPLASSAKSTSASGTSDAISSAVSSMVSITHSGSASPSQTSYSHASPAATTAPSLGEGIKAPKNNTIAILIIVVVALLAFLFLTVLGYLIYQICRGECPKCKEKDREMKLLIKGDPITAAMVRERDRSFGTKSTLGTPYNGTPWPDPEAATARVFRNVDAHAPVPGTTYDRPAPTVASPSYSVKQNRKTALNNLEGKHSTAYSQSLEPPLPPIPTHATNSPYSSSYYSENPYGFSTTTVNHPPHFTAGYNMDRLPDNDLAADYRRACYEASQDDNPYREKARETANHLAEQIRIREKRRTGGYGGLTPPHVAGMQDVDLEEQGGVKKQGGMGRAFR